MFSLLIHMHAATDLRSLMRADREGAGRILALLEQIQADQRLLDRLTDHGFENKAFNVSRYQAFYRKGYNLWRLKIWDLGNRLLPYRVIYAFHPVSTVNRTPRYLVLGVIHREFDYEPDHPFTIRILDDYNAL